MTTIYRSTRSNHINMTASQAILQGLSPDGGLFVLKDFPNHYINVSEIVNLNYKEVAQTIFQLFLTDFSHDAIKECVQLAYEDKFTTKDITPLKQVGDDFILELFHGPTNAFKDVALSILPHFMDHSLSIQDEAKKILILTATSGDTGKAALEGFKDNKAIDIMVFFPNEGVSSIQKLQMQTQVGHNLRVCGIDGNFDDAQTQIKQLFNNSEIIAELDQANIQLSSANSVNIGRLIPQIVYYFYAYSQLVNNQEIQVDESVDFIVPTGNFGNILAGFYAKKLGLPIRRLVCASNENKVLHDFLQTGIYDARRDFLMTTSPSMDILISSNLERLLFEVSGQNSNLINQWMDKLATHGYFSVDSDTLKEIQQTFRSGYATDEDVKQTIQSVYKELDYLLDPHTAVAYKVMKEQEEFGYKQIVLATASPYKFTESVLDALNLSEDNATDELFARMSLLERETGFPVPDNLAELLELPILFNDCISTEEMSHYVLTHGKGD